MKGIIGSVISWVVLFAVRLGLEWLADRYEFFGQWLIVATVALVAISIVLAVTFITYIVERLLILKGIIPQNEEETPAEARKKVSEKAARADRKSDKKERRARRAAQKEAYRDKVHRVEAYEKRWRRGI